MGRAAPQSKECSPFPSPCGVLVLKLWNIVSDAHLLRGFRPLAGFWFLNEEFKRALADDADSFRPLAGFWFLNRKNSTSTSTKRDGFRPLAGFWFLNKISITERDIAGAVSVPLRGSDS